MKRLILASQSPRRKELLSLMGVQFQAIASDFVEQLDNGRTPQEVAQELGLGKARDVAAQHPDALVIGSDTIVYINNEQLGKPADEPDARRMLHMLAGKVSYVTSSIALVCSATGLEHTAASTTSVHFKPLNAEAIDAYIQTGDWKDKAGAFGIQSGAAPLIDCIEGDYDTIVGLPTRLLANMLEEQGIAAKPAQLELPVPQHTPALL